MPRIIERGHGRPIVIVPGIQGRYEWGLPTVEALAALGRVMTFSLADEPTSDFAWSEAAGFENYLTQLGEVVRTTAVERPVLVGVSYGGLIAAEYAARHPGAVVGARPGVRAAAGVATAGTHRALSEDAASAWRRVFWIGAPLRVYPGAQGGAARQPPPLAVRAGPRSDDRRRAGVVGAHGAAAALAGGRRVLARPAARRAGPHRHRRSRARDRRAAGRHPEVSRLAARRPRRHPGRHRSQRQRHEAAPLRRGRRRSAGGGAGRGARGRHRPAATPIGEPHVPTEFLREIAGPSGPLEARLDLPDRTGPGGGGLRPSPPAAWRHHAHQGALSDRQGPHARRRRRAALQLPGRRPERRLVRRRPRRDRTTSGPPSPSPRSGFPACRSGQSGCRSARGSPPRSVRPIRASRSCSRWRPAVDRYDYSPLAAAAKPTFIVHGEEDELIPAAEVRRFYGTLAEPRELVMIEHANHLFEGRATLVGDAVEGLLADWEA